MIDKIRDILLIFITVVVMVGLLTALIIVILYFFAPAVSGSIVSFLFGDGIFLFWIWLVCFILGYNAQDKGPEKEDDGIPEHLRYNRKSYQKGYEEIKTPPRTASPHATGASDGGVSGGESGSGHYEAGLDDSGDSGWQGGDSSSNAPGDAGD